MNDLLNSIVSNSTIKMTAPIMKSKVYGKKDMAPTQVPMVNVALSGRIDGGLTPGLLVLAGPSKHFKSAFALLMAGAFMKRNPDAILMFFDAEFGTPQAYFESFGIDMDRVAHIPITDVEQLKFEMMQQLDKIEPKHYGNIVMVVDSIGNLASKKEVQDSLDGKSVADMSRAKSIKSLFRMVTPHLNLKNIPLIAVNHTYQTQEMYSKAVVSGGTGIMYSADTVWIIGRQQDKVGTEIQGYHFVINIEKSRYVREKSKIPISVSWDSGIMKWSGLMEVAEKGGYLTKPKVGWYEAIDPETGVVLSDKLMRAKEIVDNKDFWLNMFEETNFGKYIKDSFTIGASGAIMRDDEVSAEVIDELIDDNEE